MLDQIYKHSVSMPIPKGMITYKIFIERLKQLGYQLDISVEKDFRSDITYYLTVGSKSNNIFISSYPLKSSIILDEWNEDLFYTIASIKNTAKINKNADNKKLVGYKLIHPWPGCGLFKNTIYKVSDKSDKLFYYTLSKTRVFTDVDKIIVDAYSDLFEKVYTDLNKTIDFTIRTISGDVSTVISNKGLHIGTDTLSMQHIKAVYDKVSKTSTKINDWKVYVETISVGCQKGIDINQIKEIIDIYNHNFKI